eukprot:4093373-Prymnesium_polylepis.1
MPERQNRTRENTTSTGQRELHGPHVQLARSACGAHACSAALPAAAVRVGVHPMTVSVYYQHAGRHGAPSRQAGTYPLAS